MLLKSQIVPDKKKTLFSEEKKKKLKNPHTTLFYRWLRKCRNKTTKY